MSRRTKIDVQREISRYTADFLDERVGAETVAIKTILFGNLLAIFVTPYSLPNEPGREQYRHVRTGASDRVDALMWKSFIEEITKCKVINLHMILGQEDRQLVIVALSENLEDQLPKPHEAQSTNEGDLKYFEQPLLDKRREAIRDEGTWLALNAEHPGKMEQNRESYISSIKEENESCWPDAAFATN